VAPAWSAAVPGVEALRHPPVRSSHSHAPLPRGGGHRPAPTGGQQAWADAREGAGPERRARARAGASSARRGPANRPDPPSLPTDPSLPTTLPACPLSCRPEPHILLFRRELGTNPNTGKVDPVLRQQQVDAYNREYAGK
jgi:hypothetical protein